MKPTVAVVAGGDLFDEHIQDIASSDIIIGADRGAWWLKERNIKPQYVLGDFDSVSEKELKKIIKISPNVVQYDARKNETDLELGISLAVSLHPKSIDVYGAVGSRLDHSLAGILLLERYAKEFITYKHVTNEISLVLSSKHVYKKHYRYCSFLPVTKQACVTLEGFMYPLTKGILKRSSTLGVSNEIVRKKGLITVHSGKVLCIQSND